jgi:hypothetical protein
MARDNNKARVHLQLVLLALDGTKPSGTLQWVSAVAPALTQAAVGAGHWAAGRRQRALAAWASAAGSGLAAWGLGTEAPTRAEMVKNTRPHRDLLRTLGERLPPEAPATAVAHTHLSQRSQNALSAVVCAEICAQIVFGVRSGLRHPRQLTARDRQRNLQHRDLCPGGGPGRAAAQAQDRRRPGPVRSRIASPAPGGIG